MIETPLRLRHDISDGWKYVRGRVSRRWMKGRGRKGESVDLPHCWNRTDTFQYRRRSYSGRGAYRRVLDLPDAPECPGSWRLRSEGFYGFGDIWLDGRSIARIDGQYLGFDKALPESLPAGEHVLTVRLDNLSQRNVLPGRRDPDFLLYGGLAGRMWLEWVPVLHINEDSVEVVCERGPEGAEILELRCGINGLETAPDNLRVNWVITTAGGEQIAAAGPAPVSESSVTISTMIIDPGCWSPDSPQLYWAEGRLETDDGIADSVRIRFGITRAEFRPEKGFFLDGARVELHGCNRHESVPGLGNALPEGLHRSDARLLKDYGCNFVRLSHYPQHPAFLDACDEFGILVYSEIATWKSVSSSRGWRRAARRQMRDMILRDRHHPSVILWGMGNESRSRKTYLELRDITLELDPMRPVTYAENHLYRARREKTVGIPEVWSVNYELDKLEEARDACSLRNVIVAECCNAPHSTRGDDGAELTQVATLEYEWRLMADRPYVAGHAVWSFADYATEHRKRYRRLNGLFDAWRQPKMAAELFRARYSDEPFISLFVAGSDERRTLHVFTNCHRLRLTRDDTSPIELANNLHHVVDLEGSFARIHVEGTRGTATVHNEIRAWGQAAAVAISVEDDPEPGRIVAVDLSIRDDSGILVRDWNGHVTLSVDGDALLRAYTDSGDVLMSRGEGRAYVEVGRSGGEFTVRATADGLEAGSITVSPRQSTGHQP
jgi:beta-galactosidase